MTTRPLPIFVSPAKAGVQFKFFKRKDHSTNDVYTIMDSLVSRPNELVEKVSFLKSIPSAGLEDGVMKMGSDFVISLFCFCGPGPHSFPTNYMIKCPAKWILGFLAITADYPKRGGQSIPNYLSLTPWWLTPWWPHDPIPSFWYGDFHPISSVPCPVHTEKISGGC